MSIKKFEDYSTDQPVFESAEDIKKEIENITRGRATNIVVHDSMTTLLLMVENLSNEQIVGMQKRLNLSGISAYDDNKFIITLN